MSSHHDGCSVLGDDASLKRVMKPSHQASAAAVSSVPEYAGGRRPGKHHPDSDIFGSNSDMHEASSDVRKTPRSSRAALQGDTQTRLFGDGGGQSTGSCSSSPNQSLAHRNSDPGKAATEDSLAISSPTIKSAGQSNVQRPKGYNPITGQMSDATQSSPVVQQRMKRLLKPAGNASPSTKLW